MNNLWKMERYQLLHNWFYWCSVLGIFLIGFLTADSYVPETMGPGGQAAVSLCDILDGMVYDSTFLLIIIASVLALMLGQEFSGRTIDQEICAGHSRQKIFCSKIMTYLIAFNIMAIVYPVAGCVRELGRFGLADGAGLLLHFIRAVIYSFVTNSAVFLIPIFYCFVLRNMAKAIAAAALTTFILSLYLGYGMMLGMPVRFLPIYQIRNVIIHPTAIVAWEALVVSFGWCAVLFIVTWQAFRRCDLK